VSIFLDGCIYDEPTNHVIYGKPATFFFLFLSFTFVRITGKKAEKSHTQKMQKERNNLRLIGGQRIGFWENLPPVQYTSDSHCLMYEREKGGSGLAADHLGWTGRDGTIILTIGGWKLTTVDKNARYN
jgi:hypothetical protein